MKANHPKQNLKRLPTILSKTLPAKAQRYSTGGDYFMRRERLHIRVSELGDWRMELMLGVHELCEALMCMDQGISFKAIDRWDMAYEKNRKPGDESEPGEHKGCPYRDAHLTALRIEMAMAVELGVDWCAYERRLNEVVP